MSDLFAADDGATLIDESEREGLIPRHITLQRELNEYEQRGIGEAEAWLLGRRHNLMTERFIRQLHKQMFRGVWRWAGEFRKTEKNIGIDPVQIPTQLKLLVDDTRHWIARATFDVDEISIRFHHRLVRIHPFSNGNGRHARLVSDALVIQLGGQRFTWGRTNLLLQGAGREQYIAALKVADNDPNNIGPLRAFARS